MATTSPAQPCSGPTATAPVRSGWSYPESLQAVQDAFWDESPLNQILFLDGIAPDRSRSTGQMDGVPAMHSFALCRLFGVIQEPTIRQLRYAVAVDDEGQVWFSTYPTQDPNTYEISDSELIKYSYGDQTGYSNRDILGGNLIMALAVDKDGK